MRGERVRKEVEECKNNCSCRIRKEMHQRVEMSNLLDITKRDTHTRATVDQVKVQITTR